MDELFYDLFQHIYGHIKVKKKSEILHGLQLVSVNSSTLQTVTFAIMESIALEPVTVLEMLHVIL